MNIVRRRMAQNNDPQTRADTNHDGALSYREMQKELKRRGVSAKGSKAELASRLK